MISGIARLVRLLVCAVWLGGQLGGLAAWQLEPLLLSLEPLSPPASQLLTPTSQALAPADQHQQVSTPRPPLADLTRAALGGLMGLEVQNSSAPSPVGKILETGLASVLDQVGGKQSGANASAPETAKPVAKTRKQSELSARNQASPSNLEQIINQHAKLHPSSGSHQRLLANTQRDHKVLGSLSASSDTSAGFTLAGLLDRLRSASISSRSSIVKAISDNRLTRSK